MGWNQKYCLGAKTKQSYATNLCTNEFSNINSRFASPIVKHRDKFVSFDMCIRFFILD